MHLLLYRARRHASTHAGRVFEARRHERQERDAGRQLRSRLCVRGVQPAHRGPRSAPSGGFSRRRGPCIERVRALRGDDSVGGHRGSCTPNGARWSALERTMRRVFQTDVYRLRLDPRSTAPHPSQERRLSPPMSPRPSSSSTTRSAGPVRCMTRRSTRSLRQPCRVVRRGGSGSE